MASWLPKAIEGPAMELSLLLCPSIWKLLERARSPFTDISAPLLLLKLASPAVATPGMNRASESNVFPTGRLFTFSELKVSEIWSELDSTSGGALSTVTVYEAGTH